MKHVRRLIIMEYTVIIHLAEEGGYWAEVPILPGCFSQGETIEETFKNIEDAIKCHIEALKEDGQEIPVEDNFILSRVKVA